MLRELDSDLFIYGEPKVYRDSFLLNGYKVGVLILKSSASNENEDSLFVSFKNEVIRFGVSDGAGGHPRGKDASYETSNIMRKVSEYSVLSQIEKANEQVIALKAGAKSTLSVAEIIGDSVRYYFVGDSEIIHWNSVGRILYNSIPNSPVGHKIAAGLISQENSLDDPDRHYVNSLIGDDLIKINATNGIELKRGHFVLVGTDGLFDNVSHRELTSLIGEGSFEKIFSSLADKCIDRHYSNWKKEDDIAFILLSKL